MELSSRLHKRKSFVPNKSRLVGCKLEKIQSVTVWTERSGPWEDRKQSKVPRVKSSSVRNLGKSDTWTHRSVPSRRRPPPPPTGRHLLRPHYQYHRNTRPGSSAMFNNSAAAHWSCNRCPRRVWRRGFNSWWGKSWNAGGGSAAETSRHESNYDTKLMDHNGKEENSRTFPALADTVIQGQNVLCKRAMGWIVQARWWREKQSIVLYYSNKGAVQCRRKT